MKNIKTFEQLNEDKKAPLKDLLKDKSIEPGDFISMKGWSKALVDGIDYNKKIISLQFKEDGPINDYKFDDDSLEKGNIMTKLWENEVNEASGKYPMLDEVVKNMSNDIAKLINERAAEIKKDPDNKELIKKMPYVAQYILEEIVKNLKERI